MNLGKNWIRSVPISSSKCWDRCLVDTGSQRSYFSGNVLEQIKCREDSLSTIKYDIKTFIGCESRELKETMLEIYLDSKAKTEMPILVDQQMKLEYEVSDLNLALKNISKFFKLADTSYCTNSDNSKIKLDGLIGTDLIQFLPKFNLVRCMNGSAFETLNGLIPFGHVEHFMYPHQIKPVFHQQSESDQEQQTTFNEVSLPESEVDNSLVNFVVEPAKSYFHPLDHIFSESEVEHGLESMFSMESIGLPNPDNECSTEDELRIQQFNDNILFKDNRYYVDLPWYSEKVNQVPSNHQVALAVLNRVYKNLESKSLVDSYWKVFDQYLKDGIIERIEVKPEDFSKHIWIPHRPVIKTQTQVSTKLRVVLNCSLRVGDAPSINDAAYTGVDLMTSLPKLLLQFRCNDFVLLGDIRQAFLQIKLKSEIDKNRFSIFWMENGKLVAFRYTTIVFGYTSSPFILNYVIKKHVSSYPDDDVTKLLSSNFYVDNLILTGNNADNLKSIYQESNRRMTEGGFDLRSWNSNNTSLQEVMNIDNRRAEHGSSSERVLGYLYNVDEDTMQLADYCVSIEANTKRKILAETSKIFDPLSLFLPVAIRGRLLMRDLWQAKLNWDDLVPENIVSKWKVLHSELNELNQISVARKAFKPGDANSLHIFCDSSKSCYGFAAYAFNGTESNLIFAKAKMAPIKSRTLPTLELLSSYLAMKCLPVILSGFEDCKFEFVNILVDAQIVLSWILADDIKVKNLFVKNRISDIASMKEDFEQQHKTKILFNYVNTLENPSDLVTRGISVKEFKTKLEFWLNGPS